MFPVKTLSWLAAVALGSYTATALAAAPHAERRVQMTFTVQNPTTRPLRDQHVVLYVPVRIAANQQRVDVDASVAHRVSEDPAGNTIVELHFPDFPAYGTQVVRVTTRLSMFAQAQRQKLRNRQMFLGDEPFIEAGLPAVQSLALKLKRTNAGQTARATYDWVRNNLHYAGFVADDLGAAYAIRELRGDCTEYAYLTAALARANGIPARVMGGFVSNVDFAPRAADFHNWTELYLDGAWRVVDAQKESFDEGADYVATRIISGRVTNPLEGNHRFRVIGELKVLMD
jgi:transglutaminase-like putative cysteine protease